MRRRKSGAATCAPAKRFGNSALLPLLRHDTHILRMIYVRAPVAAADCRGRLSFPPPLT